MKQIIPFKKELMFKTKVSEVTSISLEHEIKKKNTDMISGVFLVTGDYKMTEGSINREKFNFDIPFDISLDSNYDIDSIKLDIDNFYYEVINNEILKVNIDVYIIGNEIVKKEKEENKSIYRADNTNDIDNVDDKVLPVNVIEDDDKDDYSDIKSVEYNDIDKVSSIDVVSNSNIFDNIDSSETYVTYYVYIVKEDDTLDKILDKFKVTKEELEKYNDLSDIHEKVKLIIPSSNE